MGVLGVHHGTCLLQLEFLLVYDALILFHVCC